MALFENYERRIDKINGVLAQYGIGSVEECRELCQAKGFDPYEIAAGIQPICFENVRWAYCVGAAIAMKSGVKNAAEAAKMIGVAILIPSATNATQSILIRTDPPFSSHPKMSRRHHLQQPLSSSPYLYQSKLP